MADATLGRAVLELSTDNSKLESGLRTAEGKATSFGKVGALAIAAIGAAAVGVGVSVVGLAADFEKTMSGVKAVSGATTEEMGKLSDLALKLGADTSFSASQAALGIQELVKGGLSIQDIMNGAATATLNLAAAGGVSLPDAATIAANALAVFNLKGEDMAHVADLIAGAANASTLDVNDFKFSLQAAGAVAATIGFDFDDLAQAITIMGKAGIVGSDAGTSLKTMMMSLQPETKKEIALFKELGIVTADGTNKFFDATGSVKSMAEVAGILQEALKGMTDAQQTAALKTMFGNDAFRAGAVLAKEGAAGFNEMAAAMGKVTAESVGKDRQDNLAGAIEQLKGSLETASIVLGKSFLPLLTDLALAATTLVNNLIPIFKTAGPQLVAMFLQAADTIKTLFEPIRLLIGYFRELSVDGDWMNDFLADFPAVAKPVVLLIGLIATAIFEAGEAFKTGGLIAAFTAFFDELGVGLPHVVRLVEDAGAEIIAAVETAAPLIAAQLLAWANEFIDWVEPTIPKLLAELVKLEIRYLNWMGTVALPALVSKLGEWSVAFVAWVGDAVPKLLKSLGNLITDLLDSIGTGGDQAENKINTEWVGAVVDWITDKAIPALIVALPKIQRALVEFIGEVAIALGGAFLRLGAQLASSLIQGLLDGLANIGSQVGSAIGGVLGGVPGVSALTGNAGGTDFWKGGLSWVGEQGPEIVNLPRGAQVFDAATSMQMASGASGPTMNMTVNNYRPEPVEVAISRILRRQALLGGVT